MPISPTDRASMSKSLPALPARGPPHPQHVRPSRLLRRRQRRSTAGPHRLPQAGRDTCGSHHRNLVMLAAHDSYERLTVLAPAIEITARARPHAVAPAAGSDSADLRREVRHVKPAPGNRSLSALPILRDAYVPNHFYDEHDRARRPPTAYEWAMALIRHGAQPARIRTVCIGSGWVSGRWRSANRPEWKCMPPAARVALVRSSHRESLGSPRS